MCDFTSILPKRAMLAYTWILRLGFQIPGQMEWAYATCETDRWFLFASHDLSSMGARVDDIKCST